MKGHNWTTGDSAWVRAGTRHPEAEADMYRWQGHISKISEDAQRVTILWDSLTLKRMPQSLIRRCELQETPWPETTLSAQDLEATIRRDTEEERVATIATLTSWYSWWNWRPEQVKRIQQVVKQTDGHDLFAPDRAWHAYLEEHLMVPFVAKVTEDLRGPVQQGEEGKVTNVFFLDETHGTIVSFRQKRRLYRLPLYALEAPYADAQTQQLINDYAIWFSGHQ